MKQPMFLAILEPQREAVQVYVFFLPSGAVPSSCKLYWP